MAETALDDLHTDRRLRRVRFLEMLAVLGVTVAPTLAGEFLGHPTRGGATVSSYLTWITRQVGSCLLIYFLVRTAGDDPANYGFRRGRWTSVVLFVCLAGIMGGLSAMGRAKLGLEPSPERTMEILSEPRNYFHLVWILTSSLYQEVIFRSYLFVRLGEITRSWVGGLLLSTVLYVVANLHGGPSAVVGFLFTGILYGLLFNKTRVLWPFWLATVFASLFAWFRWF